MRKMRTGMPATVASRKPMKGSASLPTSAPSTAAASTSRLDGPASAMPPHWSVMEVKCTCISGHTVCA